MEAAGVFVFAQFSQGFGLYLADALAGDTKFLADFFQGVAFAVFQAKTQLENFLFALSQGAQDLLNLFFKQLLGGGFRRCFGVFVLNKIAQN